MEMGNVSKRQQPTIEQTTAEGHQQVFNVNYSMSSNCTTEHYKSQVVGPYRDLIEHILSL